MIKRLPFDDFFFENFTKFETVEACEKRRKLVLAADDWRVDNGLDSGLVPLSCDEAAPCGSGLCPLCMRRARRNGFCLAYERHLFEPGWLFVTVFIDGWTVPPGDHTPFGPLRDNPVIHRLRQAIRRTGVRDILVIGAIETVYKVVANRPVGKPFHIHFLIRGLLEHRVRGLMENHLPLDLSVPRPVDVQIAGMTEAKFLSRLSYVFKQPFWKASKADSGDLERLLQWPKKHELAELISTLGAHPVYGRLFVISTSEPAFRFRPLSICHAGDGRQI